MAGRGKLKPNALKLLDGNPGKRPFDPDFAEAAPLDVPALIANDPVASEAYVALATELLKVGLFTVLDVDIVTAYARYKSRWIQAGKLIDEQGLSVKGAKGNPIPNQLLYVESAAFEKMERIMDKLGLSPSARARLKGKGAGVDPSGKGLLDQVVATDAATSEKIEDWEPPKADVVG